MAQPHHYYATSAPGAVYTAPKIAYGPTAAAAASAPQSYSSPAHNGGSNNAAIHYGTHLFQPAIGKYNYGPVAPPHKLIYTH